MHTFQLIQKKYSRARLALRVIRMVFNSLLHSVLEVRELTRSSTSMADRMKVFGSLLVLKRLMCEFIFHYPMRKRQKKRHSSSSSAPSITARRSPSNSIFNISNDQINVGKKGGAADEAATVDVIGHLQSKILEQGRKTRAAEAARDREQHRVWMLHQQIVQMNKKITEANKAWAALLHDKQESHSIIQQLYEKILILGHAVEHKIHSASSTDAGRGRGEKEDEGGEEKQSGVQLQERREHDESDSEGNRGGKEAAAENSAATDAEEERRRDLLEQVHHDDSHDDDEDEDEDDGDDDDDNDDSSARNIDGLRKRAGSNSSTSSDASDGSRKKKDNDEEAGGKKKESGGECVETGEEKERGGGDSSHHEKVPEAKKEDKEEKRGNEVERFDPSDFIDWCVQHDVPPTRPYRERYHKERREMMGSTRGCSSVSANSLAVPAAPSKRSRSSDSRSYAKERHSASSAALPSAHPRRMTFNREHSPQSLAQRIARGRNRLSSPLAEMSMARRHRSVGPPRPSPRRKSKVSLKLRRLSSNSPRKRGRLLRGGGDKDDTRGQPGVSLAMEDAHTMEAASSSKETTTTTTTTAAAAATADQTGSSGSSQPNSRSDPNIVFDLDQLFEEIKDITGTHAFQGLPPNASPPEIAVAATPTAAAAAAAGSSSRGEGRGDTGDSAASMCGGKRRYSPSAHLRSSRLSDEPLSTLKEISNDHIEVSSGDSKRGGVTFHPRTSSSYSQSSANTDHSVAKKMFSGAPGEGTGDGGGGVMRLKSRRFSFSSNDERARRVMVHRPPTSPSGLLHRKASSRQSSSTSPGRLSVDTTVYHHNAARQHGREPSAGMLNESASTLGAFDDDIHHQSQQHSPATSPLRMYALVNRR
eukprot:jgi/Bigna1/84654/fgenesh1_pg.193_\